MLIPTDPQISETLECIANKVRLVLNSIQLYSDLPYECFIPNFGESGNRHEFIFILRPFPRRIKKNFQCFHFSNQCLDIKLNNFSWYLIMFVGSETGCGGGQPPSQSQEVRLRLPSPQPSPRPQGRAKVTV